MSTLEQIQQAYETFLSQVKPSHIPLIGVVAPHKSHAWLVLSFHLLLR